MVMFNRLHGKFIFIISCFVLFVLIAVSTPLVVVNSQTSDAAAIGIATRQQTLILYIQNQTRELIVALESESSTTEKSQALLASSQLFTNSLNALMQGGSTVDSAEHPIELPPSSPEIAEKFAQVQAVWQPTYQGLLVLTDPNLDIISDQFYDAIELIQGHWRDIFTLSQQAATALENLSAKKVYWLKLILLTTLALTLCAALLALWFGKRSLIRPMHIVINAMSTMCYASETDFNRRLPDFGMDEVGDIARLVNAICEKLQTAYNEIQASNATMLRIKQALDNTATGVLIINHQQNIIYFNEATKIILRHEQALLTAQFGADWQIEQLSKMEFAELKTVLEGNLPKDFEKIEKTVTVKLKIGNSLLSCQITPVIGEQAQHLGWVLEFQDITLEIAIEQEINQVMIAASKGDFSTRINIKDKKGFFLTLSHSINETLTTNQYILNELTTLFASMAKGNLTQSLKGDYCGTLGYLKQDVNMMISQLNEVMTVIQNSAQEVNDAAEHILQGSESLTSSSSQRSASLEEVAASIEEMTSSMQHNTEHTMSLQNLAQTAQQQTTQGSQVIAEMIQAMLGIAESSHKVSDITSLIDEIAFQTNLLALNAAVEAARAGEQGRSFAVVAAEVRQLAQRSASAAKDIRRFIQDSTQKITRGHALASQSEMTLHSIQSLFEQVTNMIQEIANSSYEQSEGIQLINRAIMQIEQSSQQNLNVVNEATHASHTMKAQAMQLHELVSFFKLINAVELKKSQL